MIIGTTDVAIERDSVRVDMQRLVIGGGGTGVGNTGMIIRMTILVIEATGGAFGAAGTLIGI